MKDISKYIRTGLFENFKGYNTLLISVDIHGLLEIEDVFLQLSQGLEYFDFLKLKLFDTKYHVDLKAYVEVNHIGLHQIDKGKFEWRLTAGNWGQCRDMATALYRNANSGHQYLDELDYENSKRYMGENEILQVMLSLNEYPLSFWVEHFNSSNSSEVI